MQFKLKNYKTQMDVVLADIDTEFHKAFYGVEKQLNQLVEIHKDTFNPRERETKRLYVCGFKNTTKEQDLRKLFTHFTEIHMPRNRFTGSNLGFV